MANNVENRMSERNPMQPIVKMPDGIVRFKANAIVRDLLDRATAAKIMDMNHIAIEGYSQDDQCQFAQLIGYSICGYHELSYVSDEHAHDASEQASNKWPNVGGCRDDGCEMHCGVEREADGD
jgi:hypothetical protein